MLRSDHVICLIGADGGGLSKTNTGVVVCCSHTMTCCLWYCWWWYAHGLYWSSGVLFSQQVILYWDCWWWAFPRPLLEHWCVVPTPGHFVNWTAGGRLSKAIAELCGSCSHTRTCVGLGNWGGAHNHYLSSGMLFSHHTIFFKFG